MAKVKTAGSGTSSSAGKPTVGEFTNQFIGVQGEDGYIDPYAWVAARDMWQKRGGTLSTFNTNFKRFLNPQSYTIAGFEAPKGSTSPL